jgi:hypothetical protein
MFSKLNSVQHRVHAVEFLILRDKQIAFVNRQAIFDEAIIPFKGF